jgi:homospermidine synthase
MKPKEIIKKLGIQNGLKSKRLQCEFLNTMREELAEVYNQFGVKDSDRHFDQAVKQVRSKWDGVSLKITMGINDSLWNFFYAKHVISLKSELCPTWKAKKDEEQRKYEERKRKREEKEAKRREQENI